LSPVLAPSFDRSMSTRDDLNSAIQLHRAGRLQEAAAAYQRILAANPRDAEAMHLLGVVAHQTGQHDTAIRLITAAIGLDPNQGPYYTNLGEACRSAGQLDAAKRWLSEAVTRQPGRVAPHYNLALVHAAQGDHAAAARCCRQALALEANNADLHNQLGVALRALGRFNDARACFQRAIACNARHYDALVNLAEVLVSSGHISQAPPFFERALAERPGSVELRVRIADFEAARGNWTAALDLYKSAIQLDANNDVAQCHRGMVHQILEEHQTAIEQYRRALQIAPDNLEAHGALATALSITGQEEEARAHFQRVLDGKPTSTDLFTRMAIFYQNERRYDQALVCHKRAIEIAPDDAWAHYSYALLLLSLGDFRVGWDEYHWRSKSFGTPSDTLDGPIWDGTSGLDKTLVVHGEQGLGDMLHFVRYVPLAQERVGRVTLVMPEKLLPLLKASGMREVIGPADPVPKLDYKITLLDMPRVFGTTLENVPVNVPYLAADAALVRHWADRLAHVDGFRVGIFWQGQPDFSTDTFRSFPLAEFAPIAQIPNVRLVCLQKFAGIEQLDALAGQFEVVDLRPDYDVEDGAFMNAAAIVKNLDLVIGPDTALVHLAGALGVPVWVAVATRSDWRWMFDREDSPWYPTMRLYRQTKLQRWTDVFDRMAKALAQLVAGALR
jgi:tetratricopeptide (TPR) repeat protein